MAEGLLTQPQPNVNMEIEEVEKAGEAYFDDLVSRSFFQDSMKGKCFLMHDLISDLAKDIYGEFCFRLSVGRSCEVTERIRHLWVEKDKETAHDVYNQIITIQRLHTFFFMGWSSSDNIDQEKMQNILSTFTRLRVLCLFYYKKIGLPDSIGNLVHLRHWDLSGSSIERLPDSIASLCNLEILILDGCLHLVELPAKFSKLINLCQLDLRATKLRKMPPHMGKLKKLRELAYFIVGKESDCSIKELGPLNCLRGHLQIKGLRNVSKVEESVGANLKCKDKLKSLELEWGDEGSEDSLHERNMLEKLQPHTNIEQLCIDGYAGMRFPDWVGDSSFSNIVKLYLIRCRYCSSLPPLGQLGSLKKVSIMGLDGITVVGPEFYGNGNKPPFGRLEYLRFEMTAQLEEWVSYTNMDEGGNSLTCFSLLDCLEIRKCPNLKKIQPMRLPTLTKLEIRGCDRLASLPRAPAIAQFRIKDGCRCMLLRLPPSQSPSLRVWHWYSTNWPLAILEQMLEYPISIALKELVVTRYDSLTRFPLDLFPILESLEIIDCPKLESLSAAASQEQPLQCLKFLKLMWCPKLKLLSGCIPSLVKLDVYKCPSVAVVDWLTLFPNLTELILESFPLENMFLPSTLTSLEIRDFPNLKSLDNEGLQSLTSLRKLEILKCPSLESLVNMSLESLISLRELTIAVCPSQREVWLPLTITTLKVSQLENLESLDNWGLHRLTSLTQLQIFDCPKLQSLPKEGLPSSLQHVDIVDCPLLEVGQHWPFDPPKRRW